MPMPRREDALVERAVLVERLANMPAAMRVLPQWLLWRLEDVPGRDGLQKVPYYLSGRKRAGELGGAEDRKALATFEDVCARFSTVLSFTGVGFAFLKGDGLIGIDLDKMVDLESGEYRPQHLAIIEACASYTEWSPSGKGVHVIVQGESGSFKHDACGVEVYSGDRYFTCTGNVYEGAELEVQPIKAYALAYLREVVQQSKDAAKAARQAALPVAAPAPAVVSPGRSAGPGQRGDDFKRVNDAALANLGAWVPQVLPAARPWQQGYRVSSKDLGRDLQEDLKLGPDGIMDFGEERGMSPIDVVMKWGPGLSSPKDALYWLAPLVGVDLKPRRALRLVPAPDGRDDPPPPLEGQGGEWPDGAVAEKPAGTPPAARGRKPKPPPEGGGGVMERLLTHFALRYGTDEVWDGEQRIVMAVKHLRLVFGSPMVNLWLSHPERRVLYEGQMVFEPGKELPEGHVNLFDGFAMAPVECEEADVKPMLDLARHLCSLSARTVAGTEAVLEQVLQWLAYPLQYPGAKLRFALVFHGPQGTGKNLFFDCVRSMYGKYGRMVGQTELEDRFNGYLSGKLMLIGNEVVTRQELFHHKNKLKWVITEPEIPIRGMHQEVRWESNHAQVVFLSNELQPVALEKDDRRHLVVYTPAAEDPDLYLRVADFLERGGAAKWLHYLLRVDTDGFNEFTKPLMTEAKQTLIELGLKAPERFVEEWLGGYLDLPLQVCSAEQLYKVFRRWCENTGERGSWVVQQQFTRTVERYVYERVELDQATGQRKPQALVYKVVSVAHEGKPRKSVRCWVPTGCKPPDTEDMTEGKWAAMCIDSFDIVANRYGRSRFEDEQ